ncbi:putative NSD1 [Operophtera brumata]|uniref:Putative NSD1 n=1 Tax=Operophtera brumata TaxID=104452 RepID=A0A0L7LA42_OPEBR|nr:putative NSD1 [Operophtera brumata]
MITESKGIYHWKLGDLAKARMCKKVYVRVRVVKNEKGLFFEDKVIGISCNKDGSLAVTKELCYYVEISRTNEQLWLPYSCMHLAERSRPFYGVEITSPGKVKTEPTSCKSPVKILLQKEHIVPLEEKPSKAGTLECTTWNTEKAILEDAFKEFVRRGKEQLFDQYFEISKQDKHLVDLLMNFNASTEDKLEMNSISIKSPMKPEVTVHISWCLICGKGEDLHPCTDCPASYHVSCRSKWLLTIAHVYCFSYDLVWHKLRACSWWPAKVLPPGKVPSCLTAQPHSPHDWPLRYYGNSSSSAARRTLFQL